MVGIVLCGGQSLRMGSDKGLLIHQEQMWAEIALNKFNSLYLQTDISINNAQHPDYIKIFPEKILIRDDPKIAVKGPLLGILSAHFRYPDHDLFLMACDLLLMDPELLAELHNVYLTTPGYDAFLYTNLNEPEPMCCIYTSDGLKKILALLYEHKLSRYSMKFVLSQLNTHTTSITEKQRHFFKNFNDQTEIQNL